MRSPGCGPWRWWGRWGWPSCSCWRSCATGPVGVDPAADRSGPAGGPATGSRRAVDLGPLRLDILDSGLANLQRVRAVGKEAGWGGPADGDLAATGRLRRCAAGLRLGRSRWPPRRCRRPRWPSGPSRPRRARTALLESARAITAAAHGRLGEARAAAERALAAGSGGHEARFAGGRVKFLAGELGAARVDLERALDSAPSFGAAALDHAAVLIDAGEAAASAAELEKYLGQRRTDVRARLLLAEAGRAAARSVDREAVRAACKDQGAAPSPLRAFCALDAAASARLEGDRTGAVKNARSAAVSGVLGLHAARGAAQAALLLASLGEIDAASEALGKVTRPRRDQLRAPGLGRGGGRPRPRGEGVLGDARHAAGTGGAAGGGPHGLCPGWPGGAGRHPRPHGPRSRRLRSGAQELLRPRRRGQAQRPAARRARSTGGQGQRGSRLRGRAQRPGCRRPPHRGPSAGQGPSGPRRRVRGGSPAATIDRRYRPSSVASESRIASALKGRSSGCVHLRK